jgi:cell wall-associated NlpC family hydrolase
MNRLVGIPWLPGGRSLNGADCLGLAILAQEILFERIVPDIWDFEPEKIFLESERIREEITKVMIPVSDYAPGNVILFEFEAGLHLGTVVAPQLFLHIYEGQKSRVSRLTPAYKSRIKGVFGWA